VVSGLFVDTAAEARLTRTYEAFVGDATPFSEIARRAKRQILRSSLASELTVLTSRLVKIARADRTTRDFTFTTIREGLTEVIANFPVYRTYVDDHVDLEDKRYIEWAVARARSESRAADVSVFDFLRDALTCELPARSPARSAAIRNFARKFQQLSAPVMAKGVEDTAFYRYNRLVSLNDVGGDPAEFGFLFARFHRASAHRAKRWPHTMLATSTHDNKRSEDVRQRINVISELVGEWRLRLRKWQRMNAGKKTEIDGVPAPSANDEYLLYQILLGSLPLGGGPGRGSSSDYVDRIVAYMLKATREAKVHTSWANNNAAYERATESFVRALLDDSQPNAFLEDLRVAATPVAWIGQLNSLAATAIKLTSPGIPDIYQGTELWDYSLVDPDNRRPVDYELRKKMLDSFATPPPTGVQVESLLENLDDGRAKLYLTWRLLQLRKEREALFRQGGYTVVRAAGSHAKHVVAFARRHGGEAIVTVVPRLLAGLGMTGGNLPCGEDAWNDTRIDLPMFKAGTVLTDVLTGAEHRLDDGSVPVGALTARFPVVVLRI
jgi:(1->4)-alpha-D-glucan 1-alpha-D-glucosylmutase